MNCWSYCKSIRKIVKGLGGTIAFMQLTGPKYKADCWMENFILFPWVNKVNLEPFLSVGSIGPELPLCFVRELTASLAPTHYTGCQLHLKL